MCHINYNRTGIATLYKAYSLAYFAADSLLKCQIFLYLRLLGYVTLYVNVNIRCRLTKRKSAQLFVVLRWELEVISYLNILSVYIKTSRPSQSKLLLLLFPCLTLIYLPTTSCKLKRREQEFKKSCCVSPFSAMPFQIVSYFFPPSTETCCLYLENRSLKLHLNKTGLFLFFVCAFGNNVSTILQLFSPQGPDMKENTQWQWAELSIAQDNLGEACGERARCHGQATS